MLDMWQQELARVHVRFRRVLRWCGVLLLASCVLPLCIHGEETVWAWDAWADGRWSGITASLAAGVALLLIARQNVSSLIGALASGAVMIAAGWCLANDPDAGGTPLYGLPPLMRAHGWMLVSALVLSGAASRWIGGPRQGRRAREPMRVMVGVSVVMLGLLLLWPSRGTTLAAAFVHAASDIATSRIFGVTRGNLVVNVLLSLAPIAVTLIVGALAWWKPVSRAAWVIAVPPAIVFM